MPPSVERVSMHGCKEVASTSSPLQPKTAGQQDFVNSVFTKLSVPVRAEASGRILLKLNGIGMGSCLQGTRHNP
jgi:hypothetical protein